MDLIVIAPIINKIGGTEKVVAYLLEEMCQKSNITLYTSGIQGIDEQYLKKVKIYIIPVIPKPFLLSHISFFIMCSIIMSFHKLLGKIKNELIVTHGVESIYGDIYTAHYCHSERLHLIRDKVIYLSSSNLYELIKKIYKYIVFYYSFFVENAFLKLRKPKLILAVSKGMRDNFIKYKLSKPENTVVVNNPIDLTLYNPNNRNLYREQIRKKHNISDDAIVLLFVANGDWERKGLKVLFDMLLVVPKNVILLVVGGKESDIEKYVNIAIKAGIMEKIIFAGFTTETYKYYGGSDIFVFYSSYEGFSLATIEAAASGLPLVLSDVNGTEEILKDGHNGFIVRSKTELVEKCNVLIKEKDKRKNMGKNSLEISKKYSKEKVAEIYLKYYQQVYFSKTRFL